MGVYRLEISKGNRAGCKNKECLDNGVKIQKGELRFGTQVEFQEHQSWHWRHWGCVTPKQLANLNETIEGNFDYLDGYDEITPEMQEKVKAALEQGHVDDNDWKGDIEYNRPGQIGMRKRTPKKKDTDDAPENNKDQQSPTKSGPKKRGRTKKTEEEQEEEIEEAPSPKKTKTAAKRSKKAEAAEDNTHSEEEKPITKKKAKRGKKVDVLKDQAIGGSDVPAPNIKTKRGRKAPISKVEAEGLAQDSEDSVEELPKARKGRKKAPASKKTTAKSRAKKAGTEVVEDDNAIEAE